MPHHLSFYPTQNRQLIPSLTRRFVHDRCQEFPLVSRCCARRQHLVLDRARSEMIQYRVIRHDEYARIILHRRCPVQDALAQEHG